MLPPVVEIYVVWHPRDTHSGNYAREIVDHFHGTRYTGLIGGAVEVYVRSAAWEPGHEAPRPILFPGSTGPNGIPTARFVVVVPILAIELARAVQPGAGEWFDYCRQIVTAHQNRPNDIAIVPIHTPSAPTGGVLNTLFFMQSIGRQTGSIRTSAETRCRDLAQAIAQFTDRDATNKPLQVFISHTMRSDGTDETHVRDLIAGVRRVIGNSRLDEFFAPRALKPGRDWSRDLIDNAKTSAMLVLRTDLYSSRVWCQREVLVAKRAGMPVVSLDALHDGDDRGSFLLDHVPRVPIGTDPDERDAGIERGLTTLVDECLKRALWRHQKELAADYDDIGISWWAPHAPEPSTLSGWLFEKLVEPDDPVPIDVLRILHPDPPLGPDEIEVLTEVTRLAGVAVAPDFLTPRSLSARGV
jgi:hypothetical protein